MIGHEESFTVKAEVCVNLPCNETCDSRECDLCWDCLSKNQKHDQHLAYREAKHCGAMKRVFPPPKVLQLFLFENLKKSFCFQKTVDKLGAEYVESLSPANRHHTEWFLEMCKKDSKFC